MTIDIISMSKPPASMAISEFKATCLAVLEQVRVSGQPVLVTKRGSPVAIVMPPPAAEPTPSWLGSCADDGSVFHDDLIAPVVVAADWTALDGRADEPQ
jgi:prevent-host-death family protein